MKLNLIYILLILTSSLVYVSCEEEKTICKKAIIKAIEDFENNRYSLHSPETLPTQETYYKTLKDSFNVQFLFSDSMEFYNCYDSIMLRRLNSKYGQDIIASSRSTATKLESTENWIRKSEYQGGETELLKFIFSNLNYANLKLKDEIISTKIVVEFTIDTSGIVENIIIRKGINDEIDTRVIEVINSMPKWKPAFKFGKPTPEKWTLPIQLEFD